MRRKKKTRSEELEAAAKELEAAIAGVIRWVEILKRSRAKLKRASRRALDPVVSRLREGARAKINARLERDS